MFAESPNLAYPWAALAGALSEVDGSTDVSGRFPAFAAAGASVPRRMPDSCLCNVKVQPGASAKFGNLQEASQLILIAR